MNKDEILKVLASGDEFEVKRHYEDCWYGLHDLTLPNDPQDHDTLELEFDCVICGCGFDSYGGSELLCKDHYADLKQGKVETDITIGFGYDMPDCKEAGEYGRLIFQNGNRFIVLLEDGSVVRDFNYFDVEEVI